tara:strand:- start:47 stop:535 length:489 start_codon:yes stop_codon:yes gene_type:complete
MTLQPKLIGLCGAKGVGKSTYASFIAGQNGHVYSFATPLKKMLMSVFPDEYILTQKELPIPNYPKHVTGRYLLQTLGTDWARKLVTEDIWMLMLRERLVKDMEEKATPMVIDDLRFPNEAMMVRELGGEVWELRRRGFKPSNDNHVSESGLSEDLIDRKVVL